jgi:hydrogenase maturation protease
MKPTEQRKASSADMVKGVQRVIKVLGAGNYLMADDGVGIHILEKLEKMNLSDVELVNVGVGGLAILDYMEDADDIIIIDAVRGGGREPGSIYKFTDKELPPANLFMMSLHDLNLVDTLRLGREIQPELMPDDITIIGIEVERVEGICTDLSPRVEAATDGVLQLVFEEIQRFKN